MIATVTLNPALDLFYTVERMDMDAVLRTRAEDRRAGGKGINVSLMLKRLGVADRTFLLLGGHTGREVEGLGRAAGLNISAIDVKDPTRINLHVQEEASGRHMKVNGAGAAYCESAQVDIMAQLESAAGAIQGVVVAGALMPGAPPDTYARMVAHCRAIGIPVMVDTSGPALREAVAARPTGIKVNRQEFAVLAGTAVQDRESIAARARELVEQGGLEFVCVSLSGEGAILADDTGVWACTSPRTSAQRAVGAGDCFMAGLASRWLQGVRGSALLAFATACGTAWAARGADSDVTTARVEELCGAIETEPLR